MKAFFRLFAVCAVSLTAAAAYGASTIPVGGMTFTIPANQFRSITVPLLHGSVGAGKMVGRIEAVGISYIDDSTAGWTAGGLSAAATPYYLRIKTGAQAGRILMVSTGTANTTTRVTVTNDGTDLTTCGIATGANGDVYELVLADTLLGLFGNNTFQGGASYDVADNVQTWGGAAWLTFYYNTTRSRWERDSDTGASPTRDNFVLRPDRGVMIRRRGGTDLTFRVNGRVPDVAPRFVQSLPGFTFFTDGVPKDITLASLSMQTRAAGWQGGTVPSTALTTADTIQVWGGAAWLIFYYDTANSRWQRDDGTNRDTFVVPAGRPMMIRRLNSGSSLDAVVPLPLPYTL